MTAVGAGLVLLGVLLPWISVVGLLSMSIDGINTDDGKLMLIVCLVVGLVAGVGVSWRERRSGGFILVLSLVLAAFAIYEGVHVATSLHATADSEMVQVSVGSGLWLCMAGGVVAVVGGLVAVADQNRS